MEPIIKFLEQYWGISILGTFTVGTLLTFIIVQIREWAKNKIKNQHALELIEALAKATQELDDAKKREQALNDKLETQEQERSEVQAVTFKILSFLVLASKMSADDKNTLKEDIVALGTKTIKVVETKGSEAIVETHEVIVDKATDIIKEVSTQADTLLGKYTTESK